MPVNSVARAAYFSSTSAGAIAGSRSVELRRTRGSFTASVFQPWWTSTPEKGAGPLILPMQPVFVRRIASGDLHCRPLTLFAHRADPEVLLQGGLASGVHDARGCPDLRVVMRVDVVHQEIDQPAPGLQHC